MNPIRLGLIDEGSAFHAEEQVRLTQRRVDKLGEEITAVARDIAESFWLTSHPHFRTALKLVQLPSATSEALIRKHRLLDDSEIFTRSVVLFEAIATRAIKRGTLQVFFTEVDAA